MDTKKNIYMLQVNFPYGKTAHLPYTAGALMAYAMADGRVRENYELKEIFFLREDTDTLLDKIENPEVIGFSSYIWNFEYNKFIAREIKKRYSDCVVIFGGHHIVPGGNLLEDCGYIDFCIHGEGEEAFRRLLLSVIGYDNPCNIPGVSYRSEGRVITNPSVISDAEIIDYPSPYLGGYFDRILAENKNTAFMSLIETTRGCPNSCSYCDWSNMKSRIRKFPLERVFAEIKWISEHHILGMGSADSNFGIFERDEQITDYIIEMYLKNGFPKGYQTSYAKNSNERIFRIGCSLEKYRLSKGITLSFQSMDNGVLANIGRKNISVEHYRELMDMYNAEGIGTYTELILGLPGETYESFSEGIDRLLCLGQHNSIYIHNCEWLPCSVMGSKEYTEKYKIGTSRILLNQPHIESDISDGINEYSNLVTSTYSMSQEDWINMNLFSFTVQCFHHMGIFQLISLYLYNEKQIKYGEFYEKVLHWLKNSSNCASEAIGVIIEKLRAIVGGDENSRFTITDKRFGSVHWPFEEYLFLCTVWDLNGFYADAEGFLAEFFENDEVFLPLLEFQKAVIKRPFYKGETLRLEYNFVPYFVNALENRHIGLLQGEYYMDIAARYYDNWVDYAKNVAWFGRKDNRNIYLAESAERSEEGKGRVYR